MYNYIHQQRTGENEMKAVLNLRASALMVADQACVFARETPRGWYWYSNIGRVGRKTDFRNAELALRAAAKTLGIGVLAVIREHE